MKFQVSNLFLTFVSVSTAFASTAADVKADLAAVTEATNKLDAQAIAFPYTGGTLAGVQAIHVSATALITLVDNGKTDAINIIPKPSSIADATDILGLVNNLKPSLRIAILHIADKRPPLSELPGALSTVRGDVISLKTSTVALINALIDATPPSLVPQAISLRDEIVTYFNTFVLL